MTFRTEYAHSIVARQVETHGVRRDTSEVLRIGLTGGIGSGKSEVARRFAAWGAVVVDADRIAREVVEPGTPGFGQVVAEFGDTVLGADGTLDRDQLGRIVFADPAARRRLEAVVHPLVGERAAQLMAEAPADAVVVYDVPLLVENGLAGAYDAVVVVDAPDEMRLDRLVRRRGMTEPDARARIGAQASRAERLAAADYVIGNDGTLADLERAAADVWARVNKTISAQRPGGG
jgi:dephospho-CoA kinase